MGWFGITRLENLLDVLGLEPYGEAGIVFKPIEKSTYGKRIICLIREEILNREDELKKRRKVNMGWASGTEMAIELWDEIREYIPEDKRQKIAKKFYDKFCDYDADAWDGDSQLEQDKKRKRK